VKRKHTDKTTMQKLQVIREVYKNERRKLKLPSIWNPTLHSVDIFKKADG
jgi:hypothetical protein